MVFLVCAICCSALVSVIMRLSETKIQNNVAMLAVNYVMCSLVAAFYVRDGLTDLPGISTVILGTVGGLLYLLSFVLLQHNVRANGVVLSSTFMKLGVLVSIGVSVIAFREIPGVLQAVGIALAVAAIVVINGKGKGSAVTSRWGLVVLLVFGGMADAMSKIFEELGVSGEASWFLLGTFLTALFFCLVLMVLKKQCPGKWELLFGVLIGVPNYFSSRFFLRCLESVPAVVAYPVYSVGSILAVSAAGVLLFKERLTGRQWLGIGAIALALILLNV